MAGRVLGIFIAEHAGEPMHEIMEARAIGAAGLEGDRYAKNAGTFSKAKRQTIREVTLIAAEAIEAANIGYSAAFLPQDTRRNIITKGISPEELDALALNVLDFMIGNVPMRGIELANSCNRPPMLSWKPAFKERFSGRGGIRAQILQSGIIRVHDVIRLDHLPYGME